MSFYLTLENLLLRFSPDAIKYLIANSRIKKQLDDWEHAPEFSDIRRLEENVLKTYIESEWVRAKELDEKLNKLTASLSIAVTVGSVVAKAIFDGLESSPLKTIALILSSLSMALFLFGAVIGFNGLRPKPRFGYGARYLRILAEGGHDAVREMWRAASGFQVTNTIRSNQAIVAITFIRNGVVFFTLSIFLSLFAKSSSSDYSVGQLKESVSVRSMAESDPVGDKRFSEGEAEFEPSMTEGVRPLVTFKSVGISDHGSYCNVLSPFGCPVLTLQFR
ncbi:hypothetical protein [Pseudomonas lini]|uniref:Uncharacterized protein n=1 Tax=Pseudomonas lini TaxID=163011 RepID=A0A1H2C9W6_9PSED|nr:hypothetical protein [Pseudomonas lini]KAB0497180.1 hypothetical protein F7R14_27970 [Pseudomonas lini]SDT67270.1 hypothetical protein SAMN04490191_6135 [Pseudomonas lini]